MVLACDLHRGSLQGASKDSHQFTIADTKVSSLIDVEAKGKSIYNSWFPLRPAAEKHNEEQKVAALF